MKKKEESGTQNHASINLLVHVSLVPLVVYKLHIALGNLHTHHYTNLTVVCLSVT